LDIIQRISQHIAEISEVSPSLGLPSGSHFEGSDAAEEDEPESQRSPSVQLPNRPTPYEVRGRRVNPSISISFRESYVNLE
jgi:hypothetical protein